jgi:phthalate 4,5-cis-dihydrodiol dehydrogenase
MAGIWDESRPVPAAYSALLTFESGAFATLTYSGFAHFDSDEFMNWIGEGGQTKNPAAYGGARRTLAQTQNELELKTAKIYGGADFNEPRASASLSPQHPHFGFMVASLDHADLRPLPNGVMIYGNEKTILDPLPPPAVPRGEVIDELYDAIVQGKTPLHGGAWTTATMEVCLAIRQSAREQREIVLQHQVGLP